MVVRGARVAGRVIVVRLLITIVVMLMVIVC